MTTSRHLHSIACLLAVCVLGAIVTAGPAVEASSAMATGCRSASQAKKSAQARSRKGRKRKARGVCAKPQPSAAGGTAAPVSPPPSGTTSDPPPPPPSDACGPLIQKSPSAYWQCSFVDNFNGSSLDTSKWTVQRTDGSGFTDGNTSCYVDDPDNVSVSGGTLKLTSREEASGFTCNDPYGDFNTKYTSGMVSTWGHFSQAYGRFEVRAKISPAQVKGLQSSLWMWPADPTHYGYPNSGEIDIAEMFSAHPDRAIPYIHYNAAVTDPNVTNTDCTLSDLSAFHTYVVEWEPGSIKVIYDGTTCLVDDYNPASPLAGAQPFDQPFILALTQGLGVGDNAFDPVSTPLPATTEVDYARIWQ